MMSSFSFLSVPLSVITGSLFFVGVVVSLGVLVQKELATARNGFDRFKVYGQVLFIGAAPLLIVILLVGMQIAFQLVR